MLVENPPNGLCRSVCIVVHVLRQQLEGTFPAIGIHDENIREGPTSVNPEPELPLIAGCIV